MTIDVDRIIEAVQADDGTGFCLKCGEDQMGVEPDAEKYECECCGANAVYGAEQLLLMTVA